MKKILMAAVSLMFTAGIANAQEVKAASVEVAPQVEQTATPTAADGQVVQAQTADDATAPAKCDMKNCCIKKGGKMFCIKDGKEIPMTEDMKMNNGTVITKDGTCISRDGKKMIMKDGECMDMSGKSCMMHQTHDKASPAPSK